MTWIFSDILILYCPSGAMVCIWIHGRFKNILWGSDLKIPWLSAWMLHCEQFHNLAGLSLVVNVIAQ